MSMLKEKGDNLNAADFVASQLPLGEQTKLSNKEIDETLKKRGIASNDRKSMDIRRILPFTNSMIIPELDMTAKVRREKSPMMFTKLRTKEEFEAYEFSEKNFRKLEQVTIDEVVAKTKAIEGTDNVFLLKLLTILDTILVSAKNYDVYQPIKRHRLMTYIRESKSTVNMLLKLLIDMGIMSHRGRFEDIKCLFCVHKTSGTSDKSVINVDFERVRNSGDDSPKKPLTKIENYDTIMKVSEKESRLLDKNIEHFLGDNAEDTYSERNNNLLLSQADEGFEEKSLESLLRTIADRDKKQKNRFDNEKSELLLKISDLEKKLNAQAEELTKANELIAEQEKQLSQQNTEVEAVRIVEAQMKKLRSENEELKNNQQIYAENIKDYKGFRKTVKDRVGGVMDHFYARVLKVVMNDEESQNRDRMLSQISDISKDTTKSVLSMLTMKA